MPLNGHRQGLLPTVSTANLTLLFTEVCGKNCYGFGGLVLPPPYISLRFISLPHVVAKQIWVNFPQLQIG